MSTSLPHEVRTAAEPRQRGLHRVKLSSITQVNPNIRLLRLSLPLLNTDIEPSPQAFNFLPGQWLDVHIDGIPQAGGFTITSTPFDANPPSGTNSVTTRRVQPEGYLELAIQRSPKNAPAAWLWKPEAEIIGKELNVRVGGSFVWPPPNIGEEAVQRAVFVAGGVGINPLISMITHIYQTSSFPQKVHFLYSSRRPDVESSIDDVLFVPRLHDIATSAVANCRMSFTLYLTGEQGAGRKEPEHSPENGKLVDVQTRRISAEDLLRSIGAEEDRQSTVCYVCGPAVMTDEYVEILGKAPGMHSSRVFCEKWW